jgi:DNA primase
LDANRDPDVIHGENIFDNRWSVDFDDMPDVVFVTPAWRAIFGAIRAAGGVRAGAGQSPDAWVAAVLDGVPESLAGLADGLTVAELPEDRPEAMGEYVRGVVTGLQDAALARRVADAKSRLQRLDPRAEPDTYAETFALLLALENDRRALRGA